LETQENQFEFHRIITERVSREVCIIRVSSDELDLFSNVLRVNSTKMRRGAWQSKNLPRGDNTPWMPTFVSPLYVEDLINICNRILAGTDFAAFKQRAPLCSQDVLNFYSSTNFPFAAPILFVQWRKSTWKSVLDANLHLTTLSLVRRLTGL